MERSRKANVWAAMVMAVMLAGLVLSAESPAASLTSVDSIVGGNAARAFAISADGSTVTGTLDEGGPTSYAFIWTAAEGTKLIGSLGEFHSDAYDISADGTTIVGSSQSDSDYKYYPFKWTAGGGMVSLGSFGGDSTAYGVSGDGSVIVGGANDASGNSVPFRWTEAGGMQAIGTFQPYQAATGVSNDGSVVVGYNDMRTFRWTSASGMVDIGTLGGSFCLPSCMSGDATTIAGMSSNSDEQICFFRWTEETGMVNLTPTGFGGSEIMGISDDGSIIVGQLNDAPFIWTQATGILDLKNVLQAQGVDVDEWVLYNATDVTILSDGSCSIIGWGGYSTGSSSYLANLTIPVPEPATMLTLAIAGCGVVLARRKQNR